MKVTDQQKLQVAVAKDVLKWIKPSKVRSGYGYVVNNKQGSCSILAGKDSKKVAKKLQKECTVCAKGAMFIALVGMKNFFDFNLVNYKISVGEFYTDYYRSISLEHDKFIGRLSDVFSRNQLDLIENAFEFTPEDTYEGGDNDEEKYGTSEQPKLNAYKLGAKYKKDITRLKAIMNNMIKNKGTFKP